MRNILSTSLLAVLSAGMLSACSTAGATLQTPETVAAGDASTTTLAGDTATTDAPGVSTQDRVVTITEAGTYRLSGELAGQVVVEAGDDDAVTVILDGASITSHTGSALAVLSASSAVVSLADGTSNSLVDAATYTSEGDADAALFSATDLTITGDGALSVTGNAGDAISGNDAVLIESGAIDVRAADDGIRGKDSLTVSGGEVTVDSVGHALKSDNTETAETGAVTLAGGTLNLTSTGDDGINAQNVLVDGADVTVDAADDGLHGDLSVAIEDGSLVVARSNEGIEGAAITLAGGTVNVTSTDDTVNGSVGADGTGEATVTVSGGDTTLNTGGDGLDSNGSATMTGGALTVNGPVQGGNGSIDVDTGLDISGGTLIAAGAAGMAQAPTTESAQGWVAVDTELSEGDVLEVADSSGAVVATYTATANVGSVIVSDAALTAGETYTFTVNGAGEETVVAGESSGEMMGPGGMGGGMMPGANAPSMPAGGPGETGA